MRIPAPDMEEVAKASTYQLLLWWCLMTFDPDDNMIVEVMIEKRLKERDGPYLQALATATGLAFDG